MPSTAYSDHVLVLSDVERAPWATCGPCSLAALLGRSLESLRSCFPQQTEARAVVYARDMRRALDAAGLIGKWRLTATAKGRVVLAATMDSVEVIPRQAPGHGLAIIQFCGSWSKMREFHPAQLQRSHWIAVRGPLDDPYVWDVNALRWLPEKQWCREIMPALVESYGKRATLA